MDPVYEENQIVLKRFLDDGVDLTKKRDIEFAHQTAEKACADRFREAAEDAGYKAEIHELDEVGAEDGMLPWDIICKISIFPKCDLITHHEKKLASLARQHHCEPDGWGFLNG